MIEILPIKVLTQEDALIFGSLNVALGKLLRSDFPVGNGVVVSPPQLKLKTVLEHFDFGAKEVFEQSLTLVKKEISSIPIPKILVQEVGKHKEFFLNGKKVKSVKNVWLCLLEIWFYQIKQRIWNNGFYSGITENLDPQIIIFISKIDSFGTAHFDPLADDVMVLAEEGKPHPNDIKKIAEIVKIANKKLFLPYEYQWILDKGVKLVGIKPYTSPDVIPANAGIQLSEFSSELDPRLRGDDRKKTAVKVFFDLSIGFTIEKAIDGIYIASEKIFDLNKPEASFENLVFKLVESAISFPQSPVLFKLADKSEGMGKIRGALRLLHQKSLFDPLLEALDFARHKKGLTNIHIVVPFVREENELLKIKRELAVKKLVRKNSLQLWMEVAVPENIINLENYLVAGVDGIVLNLDELTSHLTGFDNSDDSLMFYKSEVGGLIKFLEDGVKLLHKSKIPFIACGGLVLNPKVLEFMVEKGVFGLVFERYEIHSANDLLGQAEKRMIMRRSV